MSSSNWSIVSHHYKCWLGTHRAPMFQVILTNLYRVPSIDASYQISVHLRKWKHLWKARSINKHDHHRQLLFLIGRFKKYSPLKPLGQMNWHLVGSIYGRSSIKIAHFAPIRKYHYRCVQQQSINHKNYKQA
jgi:hypothetical protein